MNFDYPLILYLLIVCIIFIPIIVVRKRKRREKAALFTAAVEAGKRVSLLREFVLRMIAADVFFLFFAGFLIIALAGPRWGVRIVPDYRRGLDVILAFDLSRSMNVRDCNAPEQGQVSEGISRLERGIGIAGELASSLGDVRLGIVIGKGKGILAVPLTYDSETILSFIYSLDDQAISGSGTNLESILNSAADAFQDAIPSRRAIILFSDGEAHSGSLQAAVERIRRAGISLIAVGLGSDQGGPVPVTPETYLIDGEGKTVISRRQSDVLLSGAEKTGGIYVGGNRTDAARAMAEYINSLSAESRLSGHRRESNPRWRIFVLASLACLGGSRLMGVRRRLSRNTGGDVSRQKHNRKPVKYLPILLCLILFTSCARSQGKLLVMEGNFYSARGLYTEAISSYLKALDYDDAVPYAEYGLGAAYFALEEGAAALERYRTAESSLLETGREEHPELRYRIRYNSGIIFFEKGEYNEAANAFREALEIDGSRIEAKRNLELSLLTINRTDTSHTASAGGNNENPGEDTEDKISSNISFIFQFLREKEQEQWKSREWNGESNSVGPDY